MTMAKRSAESIEHKCTIDSVYRSPVHTIRYKDHESNNNISSKYITSNNVR